MLVASITNPNEINQVKALADLIELRLDYFEIDAKPNFPTIFTLRKKEQGGAWPFSEEERLAKIEKWLELQPEYLDIEADTDPAFIERVARKFPKTKLIGSYHNFKETPKDLDAVLQGMKNPHFSIYKIAVTAQSTLDLLHLLIFASGAKVPLSVISMGEYGRPSRVIGPIVGNVLDYAGLHDDPHLHRYSLKTLLDLFHYRKLNRNTRIYGLIGDPVEQSPGDLFHNPRFKQNAVYVKMRLLGEEAPEFFKLARKLPFGGLSVTIPLKEVAYLQMDELTQAAKAIGAINTVIFQKTKLVGTNTDGAGALNGIEKRVQVSGKRFAILGAGGTARAIAFEAIKRGAVVSIYNRTAIRAEKLASELGCSGYPLEMLEDYDILVNTIPLSIFIPRLSPETLVMDVVYSPKETPLLMAAEKLGCQCVYGEEMFEEQAVLQQNEWNS